LSASVPSRHTQFSVAFTTNIAESNFRYTQAPDAGADHLVGLPDVDRLAVVIEEGVFIALTTPTPPPRATPAKSSKSPKTTR
jgi:hypothetical protein